MNHDELRNQNFDIHERFRWVVDTVESCGVPAGSWLLDVGGQTGLLGRMLDRWKVVTADLAARGQRPFVRASGTALPFPDNTFPVVFCCDTLEHVPPVDRAPFLAELWRVSAGIVLVIGPFDTPAVKLAESRLMSLDDTGSLGIEVWLEEHARHGLPDIAQSWRVFEQLGGKCLAVPGRDVAVWLAIFAAQAIFERLPRAMESLKAFTPFFNEHMQPETASASPYRYLLAASKKAGFPAALERQRHYLDVRDIPMRDAQAEMRVDALHRLFGDLGKIIEGQAMLAEQPGTLDCGKAESLEQTLTAQQERLQQLEQRIAQSGSEPDHGLIRRIRNLLNG